MRTYVLYKLIILWINQNALFEAFINHPCSDRSFFLAYASGHPSSS
ncbi:hypothetical protein [Nostoc sp. 2RC]|nr:hypothetical protein [Nostoc sp. 2RC]